MASTKKIVISSLIVVAVVVVAFFVYLNQAFPKVRCEAFKHLEAPEKYADCAGCHAKITAQVAQDWFESKHGVTLVKCVACHGQPDGKGSIPFTARPDPKVICVRCHAPAMERMNAKFGPTPDCNGCHPRHQNPMHGDAYQPRNPTDKISF